MRDRSACCCPHFPLTSLRVSSHLICHMYMPRPPLSLMRSRRSSTWIGYFDPWVIAFKRWLYICLTRSYPPNESCSIIPYRRKKKEIVIIVIGRIGLGYGAQRGPQKKKKKIFSIWLNKISSEWKLPRTKNL